LPAINRAKNYLTAYNATIKTKTQNVDSEAIDLGSMLIKARREPRRIGPKV